MSRKPMILPGIIVLMAALLLPVYAKAPEDDVPSETSDSSTGPGDDREERDQNIATAHDGMLTLNFIDVDIKEVLSALAYERELNIVTAPEVSGTVTFHLFRVSLDEALDAITLAGGFRYHKQGDLYYVYKPEEKMDPQKKRVRMRVFKLKYAEVDKVQEILEGIPGIRTIKIHDPSKTIIVEDTPENIAKIESILDYWDKMPKQVLIEAKILEVSLTDDMTFGVNWNDLLGDATIGTGGFSTAAMPVTTEISPVPAKGNGLFANFIAAAGTPQQFTAALDILQTRTRVNTLATPKILAIHGKPAKVQVGGQQGYKVTTTNVGVATETIQFINTGTILEITPYINDEDTVLLQVQPSINAAKLELGIPVVSSTQVSTWLMAKDGETVFIGGLIQETKNKSRDMIPCLGGIPGLGALFGRTTQNKGKSELIILITPNILATERKRSTTEAVERTQEVEDEFKKGPLTPQDQFFELFSPVE